MLSSTGDRSAKTAEDAESMTLSQEILVLDLGDDDVGTTEKPAPRRPAAAAAAPPQDRRRFNSALSNCESHGQGRAETGLSGREGDYWTPGDIAAPRRALCRFSSPHSW